MADGSWQPLPVRFSVKYDTFSDKGKFRINWIYEFDSEPGGGILGNVDPAGAKKWKAQFGAQIRAMTGNAAREAAPKPAGKPAAPAAQKPRGRAKTAPTPPPAPERQPGEDDDIPF
jgi:hypothetical protein